MKIFGIGTDIVKISRIDKLIKKKNLISRLFNKKEITKCSMIKNAKNCYAKRFEAKEAFAKALGTGLAKGIKFKEIIVMNEKNGKPFIRLIDKTKIIVEKIKRKNTKFLYLLQTKTNMLLLSLLYLYEY